MQSSAIQFVINMEIERDKNAAEKKPSYILCYWLACLSASLLTCTYMLMPVARVYAYAYTYFQSPFSTPQASQGCTLKATWI